LQNHNRPLPHYTRAKRGVRFSAPDLRDSVLARGKLSDCSAWADEAEVEIHCDGTGEHLHVLIHVPQRLFGDFQQTLTTFSVSEEEFRPTLPPRPLPFSTGTEHSRFVIAAALLG
jgi:hypothetical protein